MQEHNSHIDRVNRSKEEARAAYDRMSRWYGMIATWSEKRWTDEALRYLDVQEGEAALEIGFGTGFALECIARHTGPSGKVFGIDISPGMLQIAESRIEKAGLAARVELRMGDGASLPFAPDSFDAVFMSFTLELFDTPEIPKVLFECARVLKREGRICVVGMSKSGRGSVAMHIYEWAHRRFPTYVDCRPIFVQKALEDSGFQVIERKDAQMWGLAVEIVLASNG